MRFRLPSNSGNSTDACQSGFPGSGPQAVPLALTPCSPTMNLPGRAPLPALSPRRGGRGAEGRERGGSWEGTSASAPGSGAWYAMASFVLLGALGLVMANSDKAEGQTGVRLVQSSPV